MRLSLFLAISIVMQAQTSTLTVDPSANKGVIAYSASSLTWTAVTYENVAKQMQMHKETTRGHFTLMPIPTEEDAFAVCVESKDEIFTQVIISVFYRVNMKQKDGDKPLSLLLHKE